WNAGNSTAVVLLGGHAACAHGALAQALPAWRIDRAGIDAGDQHVVPRTVLREALGEAQQPRIDGAAGEIDRPRLVTGASDHVDDPSPLLRPHRRQGKLDKPRVAELLQGNRVLPLVEIHAVDTVFRR